MACRTQVRVPLPASSWRILGTISLFPSCLLRHILFHIDSFQGAPTTVPKFQEFLEYDLSPPSVSPWPLQGPSASQLSPQTASTQEERETQGLRGGGRVGSQPGDKAEAVPMSLTPDNPGAWPSAQLPLVSALHPAWLLASRLSALRETAFWTFCACPSPGMPQAVPATRSQHLEQCLPQSRLSINICGINGKNRSAEEGQRAEGSVPASLDPGS